MADGLGALGRLALLQGDLTKAHTLLHEAVTLARAFNYQEMLGRLAAAPGARYPVRRGRRGRRAGC